MDAKARNDGTAWRKQERVNQLAAVKKKKEDEEAAEAQRKADEEAKKRAQSSLQ